MEKYTNLNRAVISISGADAYKFLQGIITNNLSRVAGDNAIYTYLLTPQGKYLFDFFISGGGEKFLLEVAEADKDELIKKLKIYKLRSDVKIDDISALYRVYAYSGDKNSGYADPRHAAMPNRVILEKANIKAGGDIAEYHLLRIDNNIPEGCYDLEKDKSYPLHYRMVELNGVDFRKGCYVGQEVTARTYHRGGVRRTVYKISAEGELRQGAEVSCGGVVIGKVLSAAGDKALALLEKTEAESGRPLTTLGFAVKIV